MSEMKGGAQFGRRGGNDMGGSVVKAKALAKGLAGAFEETYRLAVEHARQEEVAALRSELHAMGLWREQFEARARALERDLVSAQEENRMLRERLITLGGDPRRRE